MVQDGVTNRPMTPQNLAQLSVSWTQLIVVICFASQDSFAKWGLYVGATTSPAGNSLLQVLQPQHADGIPAVDLVWNVLGQVERVEQIELRHLVVRHQVVGAKQTTVGVAEDEFAAELLVARDGRMAARLGQVAIEIGILGEQP